MDQVVKRRPVLGRLAIAAVCLAALAGASWCLGQAVGAEFPRRPLWDLGDAGPWIASWARGVTSGSWMAAHVCLTLIVLGLAVECLRWAVGVIRGSGGRRGRAAS
ncbi:hypothetical protein N4G70_13570 [Streptomyces sp. ASQP_92]|uniref:hypothetical protein n=1 Tax=Streptomyces sp. ASQP_92 TaxID=2979116 RepID=UPI0021C22860|nr:hypothetical protein [Streptomyces sp. ASQP_92]MCT9089892.1 hypothetical protein [Streptomyces sp. ASQP_92]